MKKLYAVITGIYDHRRIVALFDDPRLASIYARDYNADHPWSDEDAKARVADEPVAYYPSGDTSWQS